MAPSRGGVSPQLSQDGGDWCLWLTAQGTTDNGPTCEAGDKPCREPAIVDAFHARPPGSKDTKLLEEAEVDICALES